MPSFNSLKDLEDYIRGAIKDSLETEVKNTVKETELRHIKSDVMDVYKPRMYKRRSSDGLDDESNIVGVMVTDDTLSVTNETEPAYGKGYTTDKDLISLIEGGHGSEGNFYDFPSDDEGDVYMNPRPFISNTRDEIISTKSHVKSLQAGLKRQGIDSN